MATADGFECVKCNSPCLTCVNTPDYCTSCVDGYDFFGWKCAQKFRFNFAVTLTVSLGTFETNYMKLIEQFAAALGVADVNAITITSITITMSIVTLAITTSTTIAITTSIEEGLLLLRE